MELNATMRDTASGLFFPNGTQRIHNAANALNVARKEAMVAHRRLEDSSEAWDRAGRT
jgi:hypothetical protein